MQLIGSVAVWLTGNDAGRVNEVALYVGNG